MRDILYLNGYSVNAAQHYKISLRLAQHFFASVHLAHVYQFYDHVLPLFDEENNLMGKAETEKWLGALAQEEEQKLIEFARQNTQKQNTMLIGQQYVFEGDIQKEIDSLLLEESFDLLVLGMHHQTVIEELIWLSLAPHLIDTSKSPLLLLPDNIGRVDLNKIVFATDGAPETIDAIYYLLEWATVFGCQLWIVNVADDVEQSKKMIDQFNTINETIDPDHVFNINYFCLVGNPVEEINQFLEEQDADLLVLTTRQRKNWIEKFQRTVTKQLARKINIPLLILKEQHVEGYVITDANDEI